MDRYTYDKPLEILCVCWILIIASICIVSLFNPNIDITSIRKIFALVFSYGDSIWSVRFLASSVDIDIG